jgi:hypothetical protein
MRWVIVWLLCGVIGTQGVLSDAARVCGYYPPGWRVVLHSLLGPFAVVAATAALIDPVNADLFTCRIKKP